MRDPNEHYEWLAGCNEPDADEPESRELSAEEFERRLQEAYDLQEAAKNEAQKQAVKNAHSSWLNTKMMLEALPWGVKL